MLHQRIPLSVSHRVDGAFFGALLGPGSIKIFLGGTEFAEGLSEEALYKLVLLVSHLCPQQFFPVGIKENAYKNDNL